MVVTSALDLLSSQQGSPRVPPGSSPRERVCPSSATPPELLRLVFLIQEVPTHTHTQRSHHRHSKPPFQGSECILGRDLSMAAPTVMTKH